MNRYETEKVIHQERLYSFITNLLFALLSILFGALFIWQRCSGNFGLMANILLVFALFFLFYTINYLRLKITLFANHLNIKFGIFSWNIDIANISGCHLDEIPLFFRYGGAGIHFMMIHGIYRAFMNFLEQHRVVIMLKQKRGPVKAVSFSTRKPAEWVQVIENSISEL